MSPTPRLTVLAGLPVTLAGLLFYAFAVEPYAVTRHDFAVPIRGLPGAFEGYRILHLTDLEADAPGRREEKVAAIAREARPDVIVVTGDLVDKTLSRGERWESYRKMASWLGSLPAPDGVWFAQGHGEMASHVNQDGLDRMLRDGGVRPLWDDVGVIRRKDAALALVGLKVHDYGGKGTWTISASGAIVQGPGDRPAFLEMVAPESGSWTDFDLTGRFRFDSPKDWVGLLLHSRLGKGQDRFYMAVRRDRLPYLAPSAHGTTYNHGQVSWARPVGPGVWHRFRVTLRETGDRIRMQGRTWTDGEPEPAAWDFEYSDESSWRIAAGTAGIYAEGPGTKEFDDLKVTLPDGSAWTGSWREPAGTDFLLELRSRVPPGAPMILLSHTPDIFPDARELDIPLILAGHTQGGQIRLPFFGALVTDTRLGRRYASGLFLEGRSALYVNRGVGTSRLPARLLCPPEAAVITLTAALPGAPAS